MYSRLSQNFIERRMVFLLLLFLKTVTFEHVSCWRLEAVYGLGSR